MLERHALKTPQVSLVELAISARLGGVCSPAGSQVFCDSGYPSHFTKYFMLPDLSTLCLRIASTKYTSSASSACSSELDSCRRNATQCHTCKQRKYEQTVIHPHLTTHRLCRFHFRLRPRLRNVLEGFWAHELHNIPNVESDIIRPVATDSNDRGRADAALALECSGNSRSSAPRPPLVVRVNVAHISLSFGLASAHAAAASGNAGRVGLAMAPPPVIARWSPRCGALCTGSSPSTLGCFASSASVTLICAIRIAFVVVRGTPPFLVPVSVATVIVVHGTLYADPSPGIVCELLIGFFVHGNFLDHGWRQDRCRRRRELFFIGVYCQQPACEPWAGCLPRRRPALISFLDAECSSNRLISRAVNF